MRAATPGPSPDVGARAHVPTKSSFRSAASDAASSHYRCGSSSPDPIGSRRVLTGGVTRDRFNVITDGLPSQLPDIDPDETREWIESFDAAVDSDGRQRARFLMLKLLERARERQVGVPALRSTDYINTIPPEREPWFPGDEDIERRIRAYIRWNAAIMVSRANKTVGVGGHIATYASAASLYEVGYNHFFRGKDLASRHRATRSTSRATPRPGIYARAFLEGRLTEKQLDGFRQEKSHAPVRALVLPASAADAGLLGVPDRLDGPRPDRRDLPGPVQPLPARARPGRHVQLARMGVPRRRRDGRGRVARRDRRRGPRGARQPHVRHQLQPAAPRRAGARQRQDHPGARVVLPRRGLERHQGRSGDATGIRCSPATATACWSTR